jgi:hypothetical protein
LAATWVPCFRTLTNRAQIHNLYFPRKHHKSHTSRPPLGHNTSHQKVLLHERTDTKLLKTWLPPNTNRRRKRCHHFKLRNLRLLQPYGCVSMSRTPSTKPKRSFCINRLTQSTVTGTRFRIVSQPCQLVSLVSQLVSLSFGLKPVKLVSVRSSNQCNKFEWRSVGYEARMEMGTEGLLQFIAKAVLQNGRFSDKRNLTGVPNVFLGLYLLPKLTLGPTST